MIGANINIQRYWGKTTWNVYDFIPGYSDLGMEMNIELPDTILLDNVYMKLSIPLFDLTVGRQQISTGVGYAWNPTDIFNTKSLMDPSYEQTGVSAIRVDLPINNRSSISTIMQPEEDWANSTKQIWLNSGFSRFDYSITVAKYQWQSIQGFKYGSESLDKRTMVGGCVVGEVFGWGIWSEYVDNNIEYYYSGPELLEDLIHKYNEFTIGVDHTFDNSLYILGEYLHNEYGKAKVDDLSLFDYLYSLSGGSHSLMQDYTFLYAMHPTFDFMSLSAIVFANLNDESGIFSPQLDWNIYEDTNISLQGSYAWGANDTEFGLQDWGLILNLTSSF